MSEVANGAELKEEDKTTDAASTKRKSTPLGDRIKVVDFLRSRVEPVIGDTGQAIAALVSVNANVNINWTSLKYMIDDASMAEYKLNEKICIKSPLSEAQATYEQMISLEANANRLEARVATLESDAIIFQNAMDALSNRVDALRSRINGLDQ